MFAFNNVKSKAILRDFLQKWKVECSAGSLVPMRFAIFPLHLCKVLCLPGKIDARSYEVLHLSRKIISANLKIWYSKMQPLSGNERPDLRTSLMNMSFVLHLPREMHLWDPLQMPHACHRFWKCCKTFTFCSLLTRCTILCACHAKRHPNLQKWREHVVFCTFSLRNVLRATAACTFSISQLPKVVRTWCVFVHFDFEMCFAPQRRALFRYLNCQKWSGPGVFCTFWLQNVLRATTACTFSTSQLPKVVRTWCVLYILTSKCASRHNGVHFFDISTAKSGPDLVCFVHFDFEMCFAPQRRALFDIATSTRMVCFGHFDFEMCFAPKVLRDPGVLCLHNGVQLFISHLPRCLRARRFSEPTFRPSGATNHRKNTVFRDFPTFSHTCIFFLLIFSLPTFLPSDSAPVWLFAPLLFHLFILSEVWLLNFLR